MLCCRRRRQISAANWERLSGGVARIISTAAATGITVDSPFMLVTAVSHWPNDFAPCVDGLNCRVNLPRPAARSVLPQRTLQERHCHTRFAGAESSSWPLIWPMSIRPELPPQNAHCFGSGGGQARALRRNARSVTCSLRHFCAHAGRVSPSLRLCLLRLHPLRRNRGFR